MELPQLLFYIKEPGVLLSMFWINGRVFLKDNLISTLSYLFGLFLFQIDDLANPKSKALSAFVGFS